MGHFDLFRRKWTLTIREPMGGEARSTTLKAEFGWRLHRYLGPSLGNFASAVINGKKAAHGWQFYIPRPGDRIELLPQVAAKAFSNAWIEKLNADHSGGVFLKAAILTESVSPSVKRYFVDYDRTIQFDGNTYNPLPMVWSGFEVGADMKLPTINVSVPNIGGEVIDYLEEIDILENDVTLQVLHLDLLSDVTAKDEHLFQIQSINGDDQLAVFVMGLNLGLSDLLPRGVMLKSEFPGLPDDVARIRL